MIVDLLAARGSRIPRNADSGRRRRPAAGAMPKRSTRSASSTRTVRSRPARVIAAATSFSARWVVASATRMPPPTSIITTWRAPVRSARYSVCPVNAMPASLITPLCTGAVAMAQNVPSRQPSAATSSERSTCGAVGRIELAGDGGRRQRNVPHQQRGAARARLAANRNRRSARRCGARAPGSERDRGPPRSPRAPRASLRASATHRSGPMPAGSPAVTAIGGF